MNNAKRAAVLVASGLVLAGPMLTGCSGDATEKAAAPRAAHAKQGEAESQGKRAPARTHYTKKYSRWEEKYFSGIKRCVRVSIWGTAKYDVEHTVTGSVPVHAYKSLKVSAPTMRASVLAKCGKKKTSKAKAAKLTQNWYQTTCSADVQVGIPWSVGATPHCGNGKVAGRTTSHSGTSTTYTQYNSQANPVKWSDQGLPSWATVKKSMCLTTYSTAVISVGSKSDRGSYKLTQCWKP
ncbi:hypothetical protein [Actinomadura macra]|uniref:hypothetical protein n=1 Tax=Actinomadura macra TaxID=46164 RepID=UPI0008316292|nr:hypothetical protein [Actinomadura macra]